MDQPICYCIGEGSFNIEKQDRGDLIVGPCVFDLVNQVMERLQWFCLACLRSEFSGGAGAAQPAD